MLSLISVTIMCYLSAIHCGDAAPIINVDEAMKYLARFGYLDPRYQNSSYSPVFSAESFTRTIEDFQSFAGLKKTGKLDEETLKLMSKPRCGVPDKVYSGSTNRQKRFALQGSRWPKKQLTYTIRKYPAKMRKSDVDREIAKAFRMWADVTDLTFVHLNESANVDIEIIFVSGEHGNCPSFNNYLGETVYAHATYPVNGGGAHFDESQTWTLNSDRGANLLQIATHEFGHSLGLNHTHVPTAVMYPFYTYSANFKLDTDDIKGIQELYGENPLSKLATEFKDAIASMKKEWVKAINDLDTKLEERTSEIVDIGEMPTSCEDLQRMGHKLSGFFSVKGSKMMEMIYCNFPNQKDKWIGYTDVKSAPVHFYVQRKSSFVTKLTPIPFEVARVNEGNAMNLTSGKFTAPRPGIYFFSFAGQAKFPVSSSSVYLRVDLNLNGGLIMMGYVGEANTVAPHFSPLTLQSTLNLKKDDQVWVEIDGMSSGVSLYDNSFHYTYFTGYMLEEEIASPL